MPAPFDTPRAGAAPVRIQRTEDDSPERGLDVQRVLVEVGMRLAMAANNCINF